MQYSECRLNQSELVSAYFSQHLITIFALVNRVLQLSPDHRR